MTEAPAKTKAATKAKPASKPKAAAKRPARPKAAAPKTGRSLEPDPSREARGSKPETLEPAATAAHKQRAGAAARPDGRNSGEQSPISQIPLNLITPSPLNPRKSFDEAEIAELAESLFAQGLLQNISVRPISEAALAAWKAAHKKDGNSDGQPQYEIVYGERRWRAMGMLVAEGRWPADHPVDARLIEVDDARHLELAILENLGRTDVHPLEQAEAFARLKRIRLEETGDDSKATGLMAEKTGQSVRNVQYYVQVADGLSDDAKQAWKDGEITSRKLAIGLARLDPAKQAEALKANSVHKFRDAEHLRDWLARESVPVSAIRFDLDLYRRKGAGIVFDDDGNPERLTNVGLATALQADWARAEAERLSEAEGLTRPPEHFDGTDWHFWDGYEIPGKAAPKDKIVIRWMIGMRDLKPRIQPCISSRDKAALDRQRAKAGAAAETGAPPLNARNWKAGAEARTAILREIITASPALGETMAIIALLPGPTPWSGGSGIVHAGPQNGWDHGKVPARLFDGLAGFEDGHVMDRPTAIAALLAMETEARRALLAATVAALVSESIVMAGCGAPEEAVAIAKWAESCEGGLAPAKPLDRLEGLADRSWFDLYTGAQLEAMIQPCGAALRAPEGTPRPKKKGELAEWMARHRAPGWVPPEARFLPREDAQKAVDKMLKGEGE